ncbi:MAG TPA: arsenate reductase ArsC [Thermoanaerobaculia bacterium]|nr:arsenate reductase ArsC [Thermoanaerobaculia bacterium]
MPSKKRALFLCTHNSARSQMAEGLQRRIAGDRFESFSAGTEVTSVHPLAVKAMAEVGIDISSQQSKAVGHFQGQHFDYVITVCDRANESCPIFPTDTERIHWSFNDPSAAEGSDDERLVMFRKIRDEIAHRVRLLTSIAR